MNLYEEGTDEGLLQRALRPLLSGMQEAMQDTLLSREETPGFAPPWMKAPPMVAQLGETLRESSFMEPFFDGLMDEMRREMEQIGILTEEARGHWDGVFETQEEMLEQARKATEDIVALKNAPEERQRVRNTLNEMNLPEVIQDRALAFLDSLGLFGEDVQRQAVENEVRRRASEDEDTQDRADEKATEIIRSILRTLGVTDRRLALEVERERQRTEDGTGTDESSTEDGAPSSETEEETAAREVSKESAKDRLRSASPTSSVDRQHPYGDVVDTGEVGPGSAPSSQDFPEGVSAEGARRARGRGPHGSARRDGLGEAWQAQAESEGRRERISSLEQSIELLADSDSPRDDLRRQSLVEQLAEEKAAAGEAMPSMFSFDLPDTWQEGVQAGAKGATWREAATDLVGDRINQWASGWSDINRPDGFTDLTGKWHWADDAAGAAYEQSMSRIGRVQGAVDAYGKGAGLSGALGTALPTVGKALGGAGLVLGATQMITNAAEGQREANRPYTSTYGAGELDAYGQRADEWLFSNLQMAGTMRSRDAAQLYQGVAKQGLQGDERDEALDFAVDNYRQWGMDVRQSMELITLATNQGMESLDTYREGLAAVGEAAKESGTSISEAHEAYVNAIQQATQITTGSAAADIASSVVGLEISREHTGLAGLDYMRTLQSDSVIQQYAAEAGIDSSEVSAAIAAGDPEMQANVLGFAESTFIDYATSGREAPAEVQEMISGIKAEGREATVDEVTQIGAALEAADVYNWEDLQNIARDSLGYQPSRAQLRAMVAYSYLDDPLMNVHGTLAEHEERKVNVEPEVAGLRRSWTSDPDELQGMWRARGDALEDWGLETEGFWTGMGDRVLDRGSEVYQSTGEYFRDLNRDEDARRSRNLESVYSHIGDLAKEDVEAAEQWEDKTFAVTDEDGKEQQFGIEDLPKYIEDLEMGRVTEVREDGRRVALQDIVGFDPTGLRRREMEQQRVKVEIEAKGPLADVLTVNQVGGTDIEGSRLQGVPPAPFSNGLGRLFGRGGG